MHRIKKYANRKMYDVKTKSYVTLNDIAGLIESGEEIVIVDNASGEEITQDVISQLVGRELDGQARKLPMSVLVQILQKGSGGLVDFSKKYVSFWKNALNFTEDELNKVNNLISRENVNNVKGKDEQAGTDTDSQEEFFTLLDDRIVHIMEKRNADLETRLASVKEEIAKLTARVELFENIFCQLMKIDEKQLSEITRGVNGEG